MSKDIRGRDKEEREGKSTSSKGHHRRHGRATAGADHPKISVPTIHHPPIIHVLHQSPPPLLPSSTTQTIPSPPPFSPSSVHTTLPPSTSVGLSSNIPSPSPQSQPQQGVSLGTNVQADTLPEICSSDDSGERRNGMTQRILTELTCKSTIGTSDVKTPTADYSTMARELMAAEIETMTGNQPTFMQQISGTIMDPKSEVEKMPAKLSRSQPTQVSATTTPAPATSSPSISNNATTIIAASGPATSASEVHTSSIPTGSPSAPLAPVPVKPTFVCPPALRERGYEITEEIGGGAFSRVYRARYKQLADKEIAVKIIALDKVPEVWREKCLRQELRIVRKLQHPHIIKVWDIIKTRRNVFIFMDLAENNSVLHYMQSQNKQLPENVARVWFTQTTGAISYMHSKGIAHRDLKNENILLDRDHNAKLTDFGFACYALDKDTKCVFQISLIKIDKNNSDFCSTDRQ